MKTLSKIISNIQLALGATVLGACILGLIAMPVLFCSEIYQTVQECREDARLCERYAEITEPKFHQNDRVRHAGDNAIGWIIDYDITIQDDKLEYQYTARSGDQKPTWNEQDLELMP